MHSSLQQGILIGFPIRFSFGAALSSPICEYLFNNATKSQKGGNNKKASSKGSSLLKAAAAETKKLINNNTNNASTSPTCNSSEEKKRSPRPMRSPRRDEKNRKATNHKAASKSSEGSQSEVRRIFTVMTAALQIQSVFRGSCVRQNLSDYVFQTYGVDATNTSKNASRQKD